MQGALVMKILRNKWLVVLTTKIGSGGVNGPQVQRCPLCKGIKYQITLEFISLPPARFVSSHIKEKLSASWRPLRESLLVVLPSAEVH